jgi:PAS domain S-box-containing protein
MRDITDRKRAERALAERNTQLELASKSARVGSFSVDFSTGVVKLNPGCATIYGLPERTIETSRDAVRKRVHPADLPHLEAQRDQAFLAQQHEFTAQCRIVRADDGEIRWLEVRNLIFYDQAGIPSHLIGVNIDVTERKRAEERQNVLVAELDHRVKNVLASVGAIVTHTRQESTSVANFAAALDGRIRSMAMTHELLSSGRWQGISLMELVRRELAPYATRDNTEINGSEVVLRAEVGQAMAMVLHELTTNAAKYGALSNKNGRVSIRWDRRSNGQARSQLVLEWQEIGGPPVVAPSRPSFGTNTIRDLIPYEFGGRVDLALAPKGVRCRLELPDDWICDDSESAPVPGVHAIPAK